jgi:hypothetical protein
MTDEEIIDRIRKADAFLGLYEDVLHPVLEELARQKSLAVYKVEGKYTGELGCYEAGADVICIHLRDGIPLPSFGDPSHGIRYEWEQQWRDKLTAAGIHRVLLSGFG